MLPWYSDRCYGAKSICPLRNHEQKRLIKIDANELWQRLIQNKQCLGKYMKTQLLFEGMPVATTE